jgi:cytochrome c-type biogenesis protein CcmH/NrfG
MTLALLVAVSMAAAATLGATTGTKVKTEATPSLPAGHPQVEGDAQTAAGDQEDYSAMVADLENKHQRDPADLDTTLALADAYLMNDRDDEALKLYDQVLARRPNDPHAQAQSAMVWHARGDDARAHTLLDTVLARDPGCQIAHYDLAILCYSQDNAAQAREEWQRAAAIDPQSRLGRSAQGFVDLMDGKTTPQP